MILLALAMAAAPGAIEGWKVGPQGNPPQIMAVRTLKGGAELQYKVEAGTVRSFKVTLPHCGSDKGFDTPKGDAAARHDVVYDTLFDTLRTAAGTCGIDQQTGDGLLAGFDDAFAAVERLAAARDALAPPAPAAHSQGVAGWTLADLTENDERKLRMRHSVGEADLEYRVMSGVDRRMNLMVGGCGSNAMLDLPHEAADQIAAARKQLDGLIQDVAAQCRIDKASQAKLAAGFDPAFAEIERWARLDPIAGY
jgi:hypothetical protein